MFMYRTPGAGPVVQLHDLVQYTKDAPYGIPLLPEGHLTRFLKIFAITLAFGAVLMLAVTGLVKLFQKYDPSFITNKIRNVRFVRREEQLSGSAGSLEMDCPEGNTGDKVMLLEDEVGEEVAQLPSTALYGISR